jgi:small subunit ribosomal protein S1
MDTLVKAEELDVAAAVEVAEDAAQDAASAVAELSSEVDPLVNSADASVETVGEAVAEAETVEAEVAEAMAIVEVAQGDEVIDIVEETILVAEAEDAQGDEVINIVEETILVAEAEDGQVVDVIETTEDVVLEKGQVVETVAMVEDVVIEPVETTAKMVFEEDHAVPAVDEIDFDEFVDLAEEDAAAFTLSSMADLVDDFQYKPLKAGDVRDGIIVSISPSEILVDVGAKSEGFVHQREMERLGKEYLDSLSVGESVVVYVVRPEDRDGNIVLSLSRAQQERDWRDAEALLESGEIFESAVIGFNRGGVICRVGKVRGFIPASQLVTKGEIKPDTNEDNRYASMVGKSLWLKVVELDRKRNRLILSERLAQRERRRGRKDELLSELKKGDVRKGRISSLAKFGAFVDLGGADGLIHLSELSWSRVNHPNEVIQVGDEVQVYVLNVDRDRKRIGLSLRRLEPEPWSVVHDRYSVGQVVEGVITKLASFGAFARVDGTLEGLIHISELANHRVTHPREVVKEGDVLNLRVIRIDPARRRMGLSLKRAAEEEYAEVDWRAAELQDDDEVVTDWAVAGDDDEG